MPSSLLTTTVRTHTFAPSVGRPYTPLPNHPPSGYGTSHFQFLTGSSPIPPRQYCLLSSYMSCHTRLVLLEDGLENC